MCPASCHKWFSAGFDFSKFLDQKQNEDFSKLLVNEVISNKAASETFPKNPSCGQHCPCLGLTFLLCMVSTLKPSHVLHIRDNPARRQNMACRGRLFNECTDICFLLTLCSSVYSTFIIHCKHACVIVTDTGHFLCPWSLSVPS